MEKFRGGGGGGGVERRWNEAGKLRARTEKTGKERRGKKKTLQPGFPRSGRSKGDIAKGEGSSNSDKNN